LLLLLLLFDFALFCAVAVVAANDVAVDRMLLLLLLPGN